MILLDIKDSTPSLELSDKMTLSQSEIAALLVCLQNGVFAELFRRKLAEQLNPGLYKNILAKAKKLGGEVQKGREYSVLEDAKKPLVEATLHDS